MEPNMIGAYGPWAASLAAAPPELSFRRDRWGDLDAWRVQAQRALRKQLAAPVLDVLPDVTVIGARQLDDVIVEELAWQLPYGPPTRAHFLRPRQAVGALPAVLGLHCHSGIKFFGRHKIVSTGDDHPLMGDLRQKAYGGEAWANALARRGYGVLVHDNFTFGSRRVRIADVPNSIRRGTEDPAGEPHDPSTDSAAIRAYNRWAGEHEQLMAKSLFSAGTTWPGVCLADDRIALEILLQRPDVDSERVGCAGLSGGGLRTVLLAGTDTRVRCAVSVGMMTTWRDLLLHKCHTHTWMFYIPGLPGLLDYPEILGLRVPQATMVLSNAQDPLFTLEEMERAHEMLTEIYTKAGSPERFQAKFYPGSHKFDREMQAEAFSWFDRWLKG